LCIILRDEAKKSAQQPSDVVAADAKLTREPALFFDQLKR